VDMRLLLSLVGLLPSTRIMLGVPQSDPTDTLSKTGDNNDNHGIMGGCEEVMANNGLNFSSFWQGAAHGSHSIALEEIRHFFEPEAAEHNKIPVVNTNLSAEQTVLFNAPLRGYDEDFKTLALKVMAFFMLHDRPNFFQQGVNTLEKIAHQYHMHEIYTAAVPIYKKLKETPPSDPELCPCVNDVTANGVLTEMVNIAKQLKYYARQPRKKSCYSARYGNRYTNRYSCTSSSFEYTNEYSLTACRCSAIQKSDVTSLARSKRDAPNKTVSTQKIETISKSEIITQYEQKYLTESSKENAWRLMGVNAWKPNTLLGPKQWISYEAMLTWSMLDEKELNDFAVFMYCKLNQPDLDHVKNLFD